MGEGKKTNYKELTKRQKEAAKLGMTYGKYIAKYLCKGE